ncbi:MAG: DUF5112 domain-containing protein [Prevotella sp.]|nr:DUF5112 domain-containing protein [Prevotella sp.]
MSIIATTACSNARYEELDKLNEMAYNFHYRNLDSTLHYSNLVLKKAGNYDGARAEAFNNKAFVSIMRMDYPTATRQLDSVATITDNQIELLIADIQQMRLCQRQSRNKEFYTFRESALQKFRRIEEDEYSLTEHHHRRMVYARTEFDIITSTYYYYVGLEQPSVEAIEHIDPYGEIMKDTAQLLSYLYNVGSGGIITQGTQEEINQMEMDQLFRCYHLALQYNYWFWMANSLQAMSEHLQVPTLAERLIYDNYTAFKNINIDNVPDSMMAVNFAQRSLTMFSDYGDVYQTAGSYRTLAQCYRNIGDYANALKHLNLALTNDSAIFQAPDLVASIWEQLSVVHAALNDNESSRKYRNNYLDTQDQTRQDRYYESRAEQLNQSINQLNAMTYTIVAVMVVGVAMLFIFSYLRRKKYKNYSIDTLLQPLRKWQTDNERQLSDLQTRYEETMEEMAISKLNIEKGKKLNLEQRAKVSLVVMVTPYIDRILHEIQKLQNSSETQQLRNERYAYVAELTDRIIDYNDILTQWIQLRKGELKLHIESFPIQSLFDIVGHSRRGFQLKNISLEVDESNLWVKADKILTLFMVNTIADNARKFTPEGGSVKVEAREGDEYVEISITDTGKGMTEEQAAEAFSVERMVFAEDTAGASQTDGNSLAHNREKGHGFGLVNCKGIIEKYKKLSHLFKVCDIGVESTLGKGSRFFFRLPKGVARTTMACLLALAFGNASAANNNPWLYKAAQLVDSVKKCNANDRYDDAVAQAGAALACINQAYREIVSQGADTLVMESNKSVLQPEILWYHDRLPIDYDNLLTLRNEIAIAALSLHNWSLYSYNNKVYTSLYKEMSADSTLPGYCSGMQKTESNKYMAVGILIILLLLILLAYFLLYYRHLVRYRFCLERVRAMNNVLEWNADNRKKLKEIERLAGSGGGDVQIHQGKKSIYDTERLPESLQTVADELISTLKKSIDDRHQKVMEIEYAEDEVRKCQLESDKLHVANSVLDNCLSTLKHETMYYPSRIRTLVDRREEQLQGISELADYYKELYTLLSAQAMRQVESVKPMCVPVKLHSLLPNVKAGGGDPSLLGDPVMLQYLFDILKKQGGGEVLFDALEKSEKYLIIKVLYPHLQLSEEDCHELFNPGMSNLPFLLCRQIVRDVGEQTNARGCGIEAQPGEQGGTVVMVTLVKARLATM